MLSSGSVIYLRRITVKQMLAHANVDFVSALGHQTQSASLHWHIATPVSNPTDMLASSKFFRSIDDQVDDDGKRACFATMVNALGVAARNQNYQKVFEGTGVAVKPAHEFKYCGSQRKLWELKGNNKDRVYFFTLSVTQGQTEAQVIALLLAHHKKDKTTPKEVARSCESTMKTYLDPTSHIVICKE